MTGDSMPEVMDKRWPNSWTGRHRQTHGGAESALVSGSGPGADDGIRTRDPHLGKVAEPSALTCGDGPIWLVSWAFSFACNEVISRRCLVAHGTRRDPLTGGR
jgi:hypothetical protein